MLVFALALAVIAATATAFRFSASTSTSHRQSVLRPATKTFLAGKESVSLAARSRRGRHADLRAFVALALRHHRDGGCRTCRTRAVFLTISLLLGPGLLVNVILKDNWAGRGRQRDRTWRLHAYVHWWDRRGTCLNNCSFASGEAAAAAWMFGPAMLAPPHWRAAAMAGAPLHRNDERAARCRGGHFVTDVCSAH